MGLDSGIKTFFNQLTETLGFGGYLAIILCVELVFIAIFAIKTFFSYEARLKKALNKTSKWLITNKKINEQNIKEFNTLIKKGPKRLVYYWQQFILYREGGPSVYLSEENVIEKPLKTSSWASNVRNLMLLTGVWAIFSTVLGFASQASQTFSAQVVGVALLFPALVLLLGLVAVLVIKGRRVMNLDDIYHIYHIFSRFIENAVSDLTPYIDFDLLFTPQEIEKGNPQLREFYEERARRAKAEFDNAKNNDVKYVDYHFDDVGVDGALLLDRAMKESEIFINKKTTTLSKIAQVEAQKDALRRNYENVQMDLQRKIQASKENIQKLIEQQAATTSRIEVGLLKQQQDKEVTKQAGLQKDYDTEEARYNMSKGELDEEITKLHKILDESLEKATKGMSAEYQSFFEKVMKSAYKMAEKKTVTEKDEIIAQRDKNEAELINVQTQIKRLKDENDTLRARLENVDNNYKETTSAPEGHYDENGNFIYSDGSYHDAEGLFHDVNGNIYDMNGTLISSEGLAEEQEEKEKEEAINDQINQFGAFIPVNDDEEIIRPVAEEPIEETPTIEEIVANRLNGESEEEEGQPKDELSVEDSNEPKKRRGRPKKEVAEEPVGEKRGRGRPKKEISEEEANAPKRKPGRPKKSEEQKNVNSVEAINALINDQEEKLNSLKESIDSQLDEALNSPEEIDKEKDELMKAIEDLQKQAENTQDAKSAEELESINKRIEDLIKQISELNGNK